ncbi:MAG: DUF58 domain-containing protein [Candidatus Woesearchaeota archaeon]|jgi:uncharacterized protein (DUF58 family)|nr:DUF58 domain-containing protein [Candidatus Woesearchaeota archaeon]MDP7198567.1 DUF58 domain-containing protein [Candidatus Woesearchaeota archaeon]MDP7466691.1 DUF58 domain-containing protein [Candidatus Woesearchaeota archaeon]MDP7647206.1 DUF58 domain-containing protein [Candidatus Woesearchaeota archaeon]
MITTDFLRHLDRLAVIINKQVTSEYVGDRITQEQGEGLIFKDYVIYSPGDDFRAVDWKVFARTDKLFSKRYEEERNLTVHVILDHSGSMNYGSKKMKKSEFASMVAIGFCYMALKNNERFVLSTFSDKLRVFPARRGKRQLMMLLDDLNKKEATGDSKFEESLIKYRNLINSKSFVVIVSDFLYPPEEIQRIIHRFRKHDLRLIQVLDPVEKDLNIEGDYKLQDLESKGFLRTYVSPWLRKRYKDNMESHQAKITRACDEVGGKFYGFKTDEEIFDVFYQILQHGHGKHMG